ncbi:MAG: N-acetyltransferase [Halobacteriales archaeon]|nr:N-acetyltransferase [Halobacteriales archaeon]
MRYDRSPRKDSTHLDEVWELKQQIRRKEGYLCQTWDFFSSSYKNNTAHVILDGGDERTNGGRGEERVVGFCVVRGDGYILFLGIASDYRGRGLGRTLVEKAGEDHNVLTCHARASNENAVGFYKHLGFEVDRYVDSYYQNGEDAVYMSRDDSVSLRSKITDALKGED